jgi:VWFA-related protein
VQPIHRTAFALLAVCTGGVALVAQQPPAFRAEIDSVQLDVRVVDEEGRFVRDLGRGDLQVFEDGQPQTISTFAMVDIPIAGETGRPSLIPSDVTTNAGMNQGRLFAMVLDDLNTHPLRGVTVRQLAKHFVDHNLEDADRLAIITTSGSRTVSQEFTANPVRLHAVIDRFAAHALQPTDSYEFKQTFLNAQSTLRSLRAVAAWLGAQTGRRKAIVFISEGLKFDIWNDGLNPAGVMNPDVTTLVDEMRDLVTAATRANVSIYPVDARGLPTAPAPSIKPIPTLVDEDRFSSGWVQAEQSLHELAETTGGVALVHSNEFEQAFDRIVEEASSYYLVGYTSSNTRRDGRFRRIEVRTTRPGLKVRTRTGYAARNERQAGRAPASAVIETLQSPLAVSGLTLNVAAVPFRGTGSKAAVGVVVHASGSDVQVAEAAGRFNGSIEVAIAAADADGKIKDSERGTLRLQLKPETRAHVAQHGIRMLSHLDLPAGTYQLRVAAVDNQGTTRGSVQYDLDVPDFSKGALSMSGIVVISDAARAPLTGNLRFWEQRTPSPPATDREFSSDDEVTATAEIYTNGQTPGDRLDITTTIENDRGTSFFSHRETQSVDAAKGKSATYRHVVPIYLPAIPPGRYVLTVRAETSAAPHRSVIRRIPVTVR